MNTDRRRFFRNPIFVRVYRRESASYYGLSAFTTNITRWLVLAGLLASCTRAPSEPVPTSPPPTATREVLPTPPPTALSPLSLTTDTGPYHNQAALLSGVCFDYLAAHTDAEWQWATTADLSAFFADVNASGLCRDPVSAPEFDFTAHGLVGAIKSAEGCDAAHRILDTQQNEAAETITLHVELVIQTGCPYELIEPLLIAVPRAWTTQSIHLEWTTSTIAP